MQTEYTEAMREADKRAYYNAELWAGHADAYDYFTKPRRPWSEGYMVGWRMVRSQ